MFIYLTSKLHLLVHQFIANPLTHDNASTYLVLHHGVGKPLGYVDLFIVLINSAVTANSCVTNFLKFPNLLLGMVSRTFLRTKNLLKPFAPKKAATNNAMITTDLHTNNNAHHNGAENRILKIWIPSPFLGKRGTTLSLLAICTKKLRGLIKKVKSVTLRNTTATNAFLNVKGFTPKNLQSLVLYKFTCPACCSSYIGKTKHACRLKLKNIATLMTSKSINTLTLVFILA